MQKVTIILEFENKEKAEDITDSDVYNNLQELMDADCLSYITEED